MATDFLVKQGRVMGGVRLVTDADVAHQTDLTNIRETGTTASQAISAGTYFYLNDTLVRAKVDIANGATFTLNTNYEVVTAGALNELKTAYSTTERVVGKWIDGSTIYEKTVDCGALPNATTKSVAHGISNFKNLVSLVGCGRRTSDNTCLSIPYSDPANVTANVGIIVNTTNILILSGGDRSAFNETYLTLRYTKTS